MSKALSNYSINFTRTLLEIYNLVLPHKFSRAIIIYSTDQHQQILEATAKLNKSVG
jgi:hypothetical protein